MRPRPPDHLSLGASVQSPGAFVRYAIRGSLLVLAAACGDGTGPLAPDGSGPAFLVQPSDIVVGRGFDGVVELIVRDADGQPVQTDDSVTLRLEGGPAGAGLTGRTMRVPNPVLATFRGLSVDTPGHYHLIAEWRGRTTESVPFVAVPEPDLIRIRNASDRERGVVVDGETSREFLNDHLLATRDTLIELIRQGAGPNGEVIVFDRGRAVTAVPAPWTPGVDTVEVVLRDKLRIPITVRILSSRLEYVQPAMDQWLGSWDSEGVGIDPVVEVVDLSGESGAQGVDGRMFCRDGSAERERWGFDPDRINVYIVDFEGTGGLACDRLRRVALIHNRLAGTGTLFNHEIGHLFGLPHYFQYDLDGFAGTDNAVGGGGWFMTEGQIFYSHYHERSVLVRVYGYETEAARACRPPRNSEIDRPECLLHRFRIWEDGW